MSRFLGLNAHLGLDPGPQGGFECDEDDNFQDPPITKTCIHCGATGLEWVDVGGGRWRLYDGMKIHTCPPAKVSDFPDLTK